MYAISFPWLYSRRKCEVPITISRPSTPVYVVSECAGCRSCWDLPLQLSGHLACHIERESKFWPWIHVSGSAKHVRTEVPLKNIVIRHQMRKSLGWWPWETWVGDKLVGTRPKIEWVPSGKFWCLRPLKRYSWCLTKILFLLHKLLRIDLNNSPSDQVCRESHSPFAIVQTPQEMSVQCNPLRKHPTLPIPCQHHQYPEVRLYKGIPFALVES